MYNKLVAAPGQNIELGTQGGVLLLTPPGVSPGAMTLTDLQNRTWHLLRENGPDTGYAIGSAAFTQEYPPTVVTRDLNIALAQFISQTGIAPSLSERHDSFPVFPVLDYPCPPSMTSLTRVSYTPAGQYEYELIGKSFSDFTSVTGGVIANDVGQPYYYREPFAGYIRLQPQPGPANASGPATGSFTFSGVPTVGQTLMMYFAPTVGGTVTPVGPVVVASGDTLSSFALKASNAINQSSVVQGTSAYFAASSVSANGVSLTSLNTPGTSITYYGVLSGTTMTVTPASAATLTATGDIITFYYSSLGVILAGANDSPGIPPQFHMALVYRVLADYWIRKQGESLGEYYKKRYDEEVARAKAYTFDLKRSTQPTIGGEDDDVTPWPMGGG